MRIESGRCRPSLTAVARNANSLVNYRRSGLPLAVALAFGGTLALGPDQMLQAQSFPPVLQLSELDGSNGFRLDGVAADDRSGRSVSAAGDINHDGIDDLIVGAFRANSDGNINSGSSFVVFGERTGFAATVELSSLDGANGFRMDGVGGMDYAGFSVAAAGDINGDGIDDLIVGAPYAEDFANGGAYVVFGRSTGFDATLALSSLNGSDGFYLGGVARGDEAGRSVAAAGDINGDGIDDLIVGAPFAKPNGNFWAGSSFVVFGKSTGFPASMSLPRLDGTNGFRLNGLSPYEYFGTSVSAAGDINGDGIDDLIVGAFLADPEGLIEAGSSFVVYGRTTNFPATLALPSLNGANGFRVDGGAAADRSGRSVSAAGDINGDGVEDLIIGAFKASPNGNIRAGSTYVVFGRSNGFSSTLSLSTLNGTDGFRMDGMTNDYSGLSARGAGDINGDGIDDLIIGALGASPGGNVYAGSSYVVFGKSSGFAATLPLSELNGDDGFRIDGVAAGGFSGVSVSAAGDVNGDGVDDLIIGAPQVSPNGLHSGSSYVVYGGIQRNASTPLRQSVD